MHEPSHVDPLRNDVCPTRTTVILKFHDTPVKQQTAGAGDAVATAPAFVRTWTAARRFHFVPSRRCDIITLLLDVRFLADEIGMKIVQYPHPALRHPAKPLAAI